VVHGTQAYHVELRLGRGKLQALCTCPIGGEVPACKHAVALALAAAARPPAEPPDLERLLADQPREALVELLLELAGRDHQVADRLALRLARSADGGVDVAALRAAFDRAAAAGSGFVPYTEVAAYARGLDEVVDEVEGLLGRGHAEAVVELAEHGLRTVEDALDTVDDSDGHVGSLLDRLRALHLDACRRARPDPLALADRLVAWELEGAWETFLGAAEHYAEVLGEAGLARYRVRLEPHWARLPALGPGDERRHDTRRFRVTTARESLARASGALDDLLEVMAHDLSSGWRFVRLAEACRAAGRHEQAVAWLTRGLEAFPDRPDRRLRALLIELHAEAGRHDEAARVAWEAFCAAPARDTYAQLRRCARAAGTWAQRRPDALGVLRADAERRRERARRSAFAWERVPAGTALVEVLLEDEEPDAAWEAAEGLGCDEGSWLALARTARVGHEAQAAVVLRRLAEAAVERKDRRSYADAVGRLRELRGLMDGRELAAYVAELRERHRRKRSFLALLDAELAPAALHDEVGGR
jgi:uncharacterized Zn finger protein